MDREYDSGSEFAKILLKSNVSKKEDVLQGFSSTLIIVQLGFGHVQAEKDSY